MTEWKASDYARISALQHAMAEEALSLIELNGAEQVLDVGCGNGKTTSEIAARVPRRRVVGVDFSADMIAFANAHHDAGLLPNLTFSVADARHLPFSEEFDLVVSFNALHWIPNQIQALKSIHKVLRAKGRAQLRLVPKGERKSLEDVIEETRLSPRWMEHFKTFHDPYLHLTPGQYAELAEQSGFEIRRLQTVAKAWDFESRAAFLAFGSVTFVEWTQHLPEDDRQAFVEDVLDRYRQVAADEPGQENYFRFYQMDILLAR
ncbi:Trans-aconitate 2-methyltransferase [Acidisarcina polymorpha]|uniref:Trans-aconitate 2-methyltransferase n=1 Tax=Acidisarcina polymorpha TaxID=2211140 RepID=A0A2Z5G253_9BACT|nr:class I SAM-dependent methyltransferase [Acidisarcina polymorpha]AXC13181.1 Trans-aconitate 2-methyltransferase [Acidisarcina polymorpha]